VANKYTAKDCNSILKYIEIKSELEIKREPPKTVNNSINEYSGSTGELDISSASLFSFIYPTLFMFCLVSISFGLQGIKIKAAIKKINMSILWVIVVI